MSYLRLIQAKWFLGVPLLLVLIMAVACGDEEATPVPVDVGAALKQALAEQAAAQPAGLTSAEVANVVKQALETQPAGLTSSEVASAIASALSAQPGITEDQVAASIAAALAKQQPGITSDQVSMAIDKALKAQQPGLTEEQVSMAIDKALKALPTAVPGGAGVGETAAVGRASVAEGATGYGLVGVAIEKFGEPVYGGNLGVSYWSKVQAWDPHPNFCCRSSVFSPPYNGLLQLNPWTFDRFDIWGDLAESWTKDNAEGTVWTFKLKPHAKFWDGSTVTAEDVRYSFERALGKLPDHPLPANEFNLHIRPHYETSEAVDATTFRITLNAPWADFLLWMANDLILTVPKKHYEALDARMAAGEEVYTWDKGWKNMMGSGPFKITSIPDDVTHHWEKNANYWKKDPDGRKLPYLDTMTYFTINDRTAAQAAWEVAQVVATATRTNGGMSIGQLRELVERSNGSIISYGVPCCTSGFTVNFTRKPFDNVLVRRAIMRALDREEMNQLIWSGMGTRGTTCGSPGPLCMSLAELTQLPGHRYLAGGLIKDPRDIEEAKALLAQAGFPNGFSSTILSSTTQIGGSEEAAIVFKDQMKRYLNIDLKLVNLDRPAYREAEKTGDYDIITSGGGGGITSPDNPLNKSYGLDTPENPFNFNYVGPEGDLQALIKRQSRATDVAERRVILRKIELITMTIDSHWIMDYVKAYGQIFNADVVGGQMPTQSGYLETKMEQLWILSP